MRVVRIFNVKDRTTDSGPHFRYTKIGSNINYGSLVQGMKTILNERVK